ncbi:type II toxin-antitoxin system RelE/ParE family toxin [Anaerococcus sp. WCA-380-WT-2B]|uniref:Type II toxin-antitoxin system RelE/ParE family toxin n=1 Tax=Anaerococcus porci TaxID=2652269 RepID=A0A6N7VHB6_9FIRM|nr:type II toxin-antitoxin system RelE/ParE family toxin [Anaerococcus porci]MSS78818.1 type II toxin-antitoxin system RelE/ParE family toxin [Anaerococcus porci]
MNIQYSEKALKSLKKLDKPIQKLIINYMDNIKKLEEPRARGKALSANLKGFWRYRVSDYRIICEIKENELIICIVDIDHRKRIYEKISKN